MSKKIMMKNNGDISFELTTRYKNADVNGCTQLHRCCKGGGDDIENQTPQWGDGDSDSGGSCFDDFDDRSNRSDSTIGGEGGSSGRYCLKLPPSMLRHLNCIKTVEMYKHSGGPVFST